MDKELPLCECGCGQEVKPGNRFIRGHQSRGVKVYDPMKYKIEMEGITQAIVRELFDYIDGDLYWKKSGAGRKSGALAGGIGVDGYRRIGINGMRYYTHRIIYIWHHAFCPPYLDHIDGDPLNNSINNLREATIRQNGMNRKKGKYYDGKQTSSIYKGVVWHKRTKRWQVQIKIGDKMEYFGSFAHEIEAAKAYNSVAIKYYGEFARINIIDEQKRLYGIKTVSIVMPKDKQGDKHICTRR